MSGGRGRRKERWGRESLLPLSTAHPLPASPRSKALAIWVSRPSRGPGGLWTPQTPGAKTVEELGWGPEAKWGGSSSTEVSAS